jgi:hypothetical protein
MYPYLRFDEGTDESAALHGALEVCGVFGGPCAIADAATYLAEGDLVQAGVAGLGVFPIEKVLRHAPRLVINLLKGVERFAPQNVARTLLDSGRPLVSPTIIAISKGRPVFEGKVNLAPTLEAIASGKLAARNTFANRLISPTGYTRHLPAAGVGYYQEFVVPLPNVTVPGPMRIIIGMGGEVYFNPSHYMPGSWYRIQ